MASSTLILALRETIDKIIHDIKVGYYRSFNYTSELEIKKNVDVISTRERRDIIINDEILKNSKLMKSIKSNQDTSSFEKDKKYFIKQDIPGIEEDFNMSKPPKYLTKMVTILIPVIFKDFAPYKAKQDNSLVAYFEVYEDLNFTRKYNRNLHEIRLSTIIKEYFDKDLLYKLIEPLDPVKSRLLGWRKALTEETKEMPGGDTITNRRRVLGLEEPEPIIDASASGSTGRTHRRKQQKKRTHRRKHSKKSRRTRIHK
jgi:hypothetical protein